MGDLTYQNLIVLGVCAVIFLFNLIYGAMTVYRSRKFKKSEVVIRLFTSPAHTVFYVTLCVLLAGGLWHLTTELIVFVPIAAAVTSSAALMIVTQCSASGITSEAVFINGKIYEWHNIYDFYIDKNRKTVIFSNNVKGGLTLKGVTRPLKYRAQDEEELEKYLESHKGKYLNKILIR